MQLVRWGTVVLCAQVTPSEFNLLDDVLIERAAPALEFGTPVTMNGLVINNRCVTAGRTRGHNDVRCNGRTLDLFVVQQPLGGCDAFQRALEAPRRRGTA